MPSEVRKSEVLILSVESLDFEVFLLLEEELRSSVIHIAT